MKILLVSYSDAGGGAFIACYRLFCALRKSGMDVKLGVVEKRTNDDGVFELPKNKNFEQQNSRRNKKNLLQTTNPIRVQIGQIRCRGFGADRYKRILVAVERKQEETV